MAYVYLSKGIPLKEDDPDTALEVAKAELLKLYKELERLTPALQVEVSRLNQDWTVEIRGFDPDLVVCEDWSDGEWNASYMFDVSIKSLDGNPDCDLEINEWDEWDEWRKLDEPMYKDVFEPLQKCCWQGFKRDDVTVVFSAINVVNSYSGNGIHVYNNQGWL
jgi:hypothetical protein